MLLYWKPKGHLRGELFTENTCWNCKYNTLKLKVLVPHNQTIREYVHQSGKMQSDIVAIVKDEQGQYTVWFRLADAIKLTTFKMLHECKLKVDEPEKKVLCNCYAQKEETNHISNIIYSKVPLPAEAELMH